MKRIFFALPLLLALNTEARTLKLMQFNAENFFDTAHDEGTEDYTFLPLNLKKVLPGHSEFCKKMGSDFYIKECLNLDWTEAKMTKKITNLSKVIKAYDKTGKGPDVIVLQEIENVNVLNKLVTKGLDKLGYKHQILIEGDDSRGIDVGIISKFKVLATKRHALIVDGVKLDTRGILEVTLDVGGNDVVIFANHWPSQSNPVEHRIASAKLLNELATKASAELIIAAGDFNTIKSDYPSPFDFMKSFTDAEARARDLGVEMNDGTHYYRGEWSSLDRIFIHKKSTLLPDYESFRIMTPAFMMKTDRSGVQIPVRFNAETGDGYSDHLPIALEINY